MEFPPLWLCLGFHFLIVEWRSGPGTATAASQGGCKVVSFSLGSNLSLLCPCPNEAWSAWEVDDLSIEAPLMLPESLRETHQHQRSPAFKAMSEPTKMASAALQRTCTQWYCRANAHDQAYVSEDPALGCLEPLKVFCLHMEIEADSRNLPVTEG